MVKGETVLHVRRDTPWKGTGHILVEGETYLVVRMLLMEDEAHVGGWRDTPW